MGVQSGVQAVYQLLGGEHLFAERRRLMRERLTGYLEAEWLDAALRHAANAAVMAMIETIDAKLYEERSAAPVMAR